MKGSLPAKDNLACTANQSASTAREDSTPNYLSMRDRKYLVDYRIQRGRQLGSHATRTSPHPLRELHNKQLQLFQVTKRTSERAKPPIATLKIFEAIANLCSTPHLARGEGGDVPRATTSGRPLVRFCGLALTIGTTTGKLICLAGQGVQPQSHV